MRERGGSDVTFHFWREMLSTFSKTVYDKQMRFLLAIYYFFVMFSLRRASFYHNMSYRYFSAKVANFFGHSQKEEKGRRVGLLHSD